MKIVNELKKYLNPSYSELLGQKDFNIVINNNNKIFQHLIDSNDYFEIFNNGILLINKTISSLLFSNDHIKIELGLNLLESRYYHNYI
jgi:hypothetical protein